MSETAQSAKGAKKKMEGASERTRVYVLAEDAEIEERVVQAIGGERDFEVIVREQLAEGDIQKPRECEQQVLVIVSESDAENSLRRAHAWKMAAPALKVLLLGMPERIEDVLFYVRGGVNGFLQIDATAKEIVDAVRSVGRGEAICTAAQCALLFRYFEQEAEAFPSAALHRDLGLTRREQQLIPLLTRGLTNKEIANHFSLSEQTVKNHLYRMKRKIGAHGRLEIVDVCRQHGFLA